MAELATLVQDIYALFDTTKPREVSEENLEIFCDNVRDLLKERLSHQPREHRPIRFSSLGKPDRQIWYDAHPIEGTKEELRPATQIKFIYGDLIEQLILFLAREAGHEVTNTQTQVEVDGITGSIDAIVDGVVVDVKSASPFGFKKFKDGTVINDDPFGYVQQLAGYANVLTPGKEAAWLAADKVGGTIVVSTLAPSIVAQHKPADRITQLKEIIAKNEPPERCYPTVPDGKSGNEKLGTGCSYCAHKHRCHPALRTFLYSTGPRYLSKVVKTPEVPELVLGTPDEPELTD